MREKITLLLHSGVEIWPLDLQFSTSAHQPRTPCPNKSPLWAFMWCLLTKQGMLHPTLTLRLGCPHCRVPWRSEPGPDPVARGRLHRPHPTAAALHLHLHPQPQRCCWVCSIHEGEGQSTMGISEYFVKVFFSFSAGLLFFGVFPSEFLFFGFFPFFRAFVL